MSVLFNTYFNKIFWLTCAATFVLICLRAFCIPFSHDETATFFFYIQSDNYLPYKAHVYTNNHFLNSALANICYHIAGSHRFVLRVPNIFAFILLCIGIYRHFNYLKNTGAKVLLAGLFLLTFNFLDFFELCRGYGLSIGFMVLGLSYLIDYFRDQKIKSLIFFSIFIQLALASNLILVVATTVLLAFIYLYQLNNKLLVNWKNILLQVINLSLLIFWIKFSFFYKEHGALDYGVGDNYWEVTFKTLLFILFGTDALWIQVISVTLFALVLIYTGYRMFSHFRIQKIFTPELFYAFILVVLIIAFYLQKKLLDVNYPEDRTGLFFFILFVLSLVFFTDSFRIISTVLSAVIVLPLLVHFLLSVNFSNFTSFFYHTMPKQLYDQLLDEHKKSKELFTMGGHRVRELNYAFLNYRGQSVLNSMDNGEEMQMNCDYYFAMLSEKPFYKDYYEEIGFDLKWDRALLKRKEKIEHKEFYHRSDYNFSGEGEFYECKRLTDTTFENNNPIEISAEINFKDVPKPLNAFFVLEIKNKKGEQLAYKRVPLNWLDKDLNGKTKYLKLTSGNIEKEITVVTYLWNIDKQKVNITVKNLSLYQLQGKGVNYKIPAEFYTLIYNITKKPLL